MRKVEGRRVGAGEREGGGGDEVEGCMRGRESEREESEGER